MMIARAAVLLAAPLITGCATAGPRPARLGTELVAPRILMPPPWRPVFADSTFALTLDTSTITRIAAGHYRVQLYQQLLGAPDNPANASMYARGVRGMLRLVEVQCPGEEPVRSLEGPVATYGEGGERRAEFGFFGGMGWLTPTPESRMGRSYATLCAQLLASGPTRGA